MKKQFVRQEFREGAKVGIPVAIGYFASSIALGIMASRAGLHPLKATFVSMLLNASAGEYAFFTTLLGAGSYAEMAIMQFVANARYLLMSCAIGQKMSPSLAAGRRLSIGFGLTDELFGAAVARPGFVSAPFYYGMMSIALPGWALGTLFGALLGDLLPTVAVTALGMGLYGMFLAIVIPKAKTSKVMFGGIFSAMLLSLFATLLPGIRQLSGGVRIIVLTVLVSVVLSVTFPIPDGPESPTDVGEVAS